MSALPPPQAPPPARPPGQVLPPAPVLRPPGSRWPVAVGYVSVAVAGIFLAMMALALANPGGQILKLIPRFARFQPKMPAWMTSWQIASSVLSTVTYGTLLLAGLALTKRQRRARPLHFCYAALDTGYSGWFGEDQFTYRMNQVKAMSLSRELFGNLMKKALKIYALRDELTKAQSTGDAGQTIDVVKRIMLTG